MQALYCNVWFVREPSRDKLSHVAENLSMPVCSNQCRAHSWYSDHSNKHI
uniref:Uncharacterized protein n=1 Tax=Arion vulgaris TaxID=1028688 RepID=A0A0B6Y7J5_9EUPU